MQQKLISHRRFFHKNAELGFDTPLAVQYITEQLKKLGLRPLPCGKSGVYADIGSGEDGILLRADFDALPIEEETGLEFACKSGAMHACGHDMHAAMLLGAAEYLCAQSLNTRVRLMFQSAEELLQGAADMIDAGVLEGGFGGAMMLHVMSGTGLEHKTAVVPKMAVCAPSADYFRIDIKGKGAHGAMSDKGINAVMAAAEVARSLMLIRAQEISMNDAATLSIGSIQSADGYNVIPQSAKVLGSMRAFDSKVRSYMKKRVEEISVCASQVHRANAKCNFVCGCPEFLNDDKVSEIAFEAAKQVFERVQKASTRSGSSGSEDFAYVSQKVPSTMVIIEAGNGYPQHHPKVDFDESVLGLGAKLLTKFAVLYAK